MEKRIREDEEEPFDGRGNSAYAQIQRIQADASRNATAGRSKRITAGNNFANVMQLEKNQTIHVQTALDAILTLEKDERVDQVLNEIDMQRLTKQRKKGSNHDAVVPNVLQQGIENRNNVLKDISESQNTTDSVVRQNEIAPVNGNSERSSDVDSSSSQSYDLQKAKVSRPSKSLVYLPFDKPIQVGEDHFGRKCLMCIDVVIKISKQSFIKKETKPFRNHLQKKHSIIFQLWQSNNVSVYEEKVLAEIRQAASLAEQQKQVKKIQSNLNGFVAAPLTAAEETKAQCFFLMLCFLEVFSDNKIFGAHSGPRDFFVKNFQIDLPSTTTIRRMKKEAAAIVHENILALVKSLKVFTMITDEYSQLGFNGYLALLVSGVTEDFKHVQEVVLVQELDAKNAKALTRIIRAWVDAVPEPSCAAYLCTDSAATMKAVQDLLGMDRVLCLIHMLQLVVNDGIEASSLFKPFIAFTKALIKVVKSHSSLQTHISRLQNVRNQHTQKMQYDVATRWDSQYIAMKSLYALSPHLIETISDEKYAAMLEDIDVNTIPKDYGRLLNEYIIILAPFYEATQQLSKDSNETKELKQHLSKKLEERIIQNVYRNPESPYAAAMAFHPHLAKHLKQWNIVEDVTEKVIRDLMVLHDNLCSSDSQEAQQSIHLPEDCILSVMDEIFVPFIENSDPLEESKKLIRKLIPRFVEGAFQNKPPHFATFWKERMKEWNEIAAQSKTYPPPPQSFMDLIRMYTTLVAASAAAERAFSVLGQVKSNRRANLSGEVAASEVLVFKYARTPQRRMDLLEQYKGKLIKNRSDNLE